jgi:5,10-methylene-tetrahydrofolate dehydrogenase/methenyl tetrahydrofolate cyclohydrolase
VNANLKKIELHVNLEKTALISCTIAAILLAIEMIAVTVYGLQNAFVISMLVVGMSTAIGVCAGAVLLQMYMDKIKEQS